MGDPFVQGPLVPRAYAQVREAGPQGCERLPWRAEPLFLSIGHPLSSLGPPTPGPEQPPVLAEASARERGSPWGSRRTARPLTSHPPLREAGQKASPSPRPTVEKPCETSCFAQDTEMCCPVALSSGSRVGLSPCTSQGQAASLLASAFLDQGAVTLGCVDGAWTRRVGVHTCA